MVEAMSMMPRVLSDVSKIEEVSGRVKLHSKYIYLCTYYICLFSLLVLINICYILISMYTADLDGDGDF